MPDRQLLTVGGMSLTTDADPDTGAQIRTFAIPGWSGSPASSLALTQKPRQPGAWVGPRQLVPRVLSPNGIVVGTSTDQVQATLDKINAAFDLDATSFSVQTGAAIRSCTVYRQGEVLSDFTTDVVAAWSAQAVAPDPRKYGPAQSPFTTLPSRSGGLTWPHTWPITWTGVVNTGAIVINNPGNYPTPVKFRIDAITGSLVGPYITHVAGARTLQFATSYTLLQGSYLTIDMDNQEVLESDTANRNAFVTNRGWFTLDPGLNEIDFNAVSGTSAQLTMYYSPVYR